MILDNEQQRQDLLEIINVTVINGPFDKIQGTIDALKNLKTAVQAAKVEDPNAGKSTE